MKQILFDGKRKTAIAECTGTVSKGISTISTVILVDKLQITSTKRNPYILHVSKPFPIASMAALLPQKVQLFKSLLFLVMILSLISYVTLRESLHSLLSFLMGERRESIGSSSCNKQSGIFIATLQMSKLRQRKKSNLTLLTKVTWLVF